MPRPKIGIEDRQRAVKACIPCKSSKKRCDSKVPCGPCIRRTSESACIYTEGRQKKRRISQSASQTDDSTVLIQQLDTNQTTTIRPHQRSLSNSSHQHEHGQAIDVSTGASHGFVDEDYNFDDQNGEDVIDPNIGCDNTVDHYDDDPAPVEENSAPRSRLLFNSKGEKGKEA